MHRPRVGYHMYSKKLKFLKIVSDADGACRWKAPDYWPTCASVSLLLCILLRQVKAFTDPNSADCQLERVLRLLG